MKVSQDGGDNFRDQVANLLAAKFRGVTKEVALTGKKADIYFIESVFPVGQRRIAIECKALNTRAVTSGLIAKIRSEYDPAFKANEIDALWIVSKNNAEAFPKRSAGPYGPTLQIFSFDELQNSMMNFQDYLISLIRAFDEKGLSSYYVETHTDQGQMLHDDVVVPWLNSRETTPLALFGGYGIGKSSYAKRLAAWLAEKALKDPFCRIPIVVRLGGLTQAQSVRDLITVQFAAEHPIEGFNYGLFSQLNNLGRFVLIFDGFDEMKHAMKRRDIEVNLANISGLICPMSKLLIFGRPDPLITLGDELFFRGQNTLASGEVFSDPARSGFQSLTIAEFGEGDAYRFIVKYIQWNIQNNARGVKYNSKFVMDRLDELKTIKTGELIRRPVHAKILADLALIPDQNIKIKSEYQLYHEFIFRIEIREVSEKVAREPLGADLRIDFMLDIAWWLWSTKKSESFSVIEVPSSIVDKWIGQFEDAVDRETALREMLIGSVLERLKAGSIFETKDDVRFFFPHRSFWEFLIAEYLARQRFCVDGHVVVEELSSRILEFVHQRTDRTFMVNIGRHFDSVDSKLPFSFVVRMSQLQVQSDLEHFSNSLSSSKEQVSPVDTVMHVISCVRTWKKNWEMIEKCVQTSLFQKGPAFDCAFLASLARAIVAGSISLNDDRVHKTWQRISILSVLKTYEDWRKKVDPTALENWLRKGGFPHSKTIIQRIALKHHNVSGSSYYAAGMVFGEATLFKRKKLLKRNSIIKLNVGFIANVLGPSIEEMSGFLEGHVESHKHIVEVDLDNLASGLASEEEQVTLRQIVERGKWAIDLSSRKR